MSVTCGHQHVNHRIFLGINAAPLGFYVLNLRFVDGTAPLASLPQSVFSSSDYSWSIIWILKIQVMGSFIWFISVIINIVFMIIILNSKIVFTPVMGAYVSTPFIEPPIQFQIAFQKYRKLLSSNYQKRAILIPVAICLQIMVSIIFSPCLIIYALRRCLNVLSYQCMSVLQIDNSSVQRELDSSVQREQETELDAEHAHLAGYAIFVERLSKIEFNMIYYEQRHLIQTRKRKQPRNLFQFLQRSTSFIGVNDFDHIQVPDLHSKELPSCWTLPVMTLARIAVSLPQQDNESFDNIIKSVTEGLKYADFVDQSLEVKQDLRNIRNAVKWIWQDVELDSKWRIVKPIMRTSGEAKFSKEILQDLAFTAKNRVDKYNILIEHIFWPYEVVAAYSMYKISSALLLAYDEEGNAQTTAADDDGLLEKILNMIADILSACLTNLPYLMIQECNFNPIETLEDRVRHVSQLFGECEEMMKLLESREVPLMDPEKALHIDEWQAILSQDGGY